MLKRLLALEFFQPFKIYANQEANNLHLLYLFGLGGLITDREVSSRAKLMYALWLTVLFVVFVVPSFLYINEQLRGPSSTIKIGLIISATFCALTPCGVIAVDLLTFILRKNLTNGIKTMSIDFGIEGMVSSTTDLFDQVASLDKQKFNVWNWFSRLTGIYMLSFFIKVVSAYVGHFFLSDRKSAYSDFYLWQYPVWKMEENESFTVYHTFNLVHMSLTLITNSKGTLYNLFFFWSGEILANYMIQIACILETESSHARISLQSIDTRLLSDEISQNTARIMRNRVSQEIIRSGVRFLQNYRKLLKAIEDWKFFVEISFVFSAMVNFMIFPTAVFVILQDDIPIVFKIAVSAWLIPVVSFVYACCHFGKVMDDATDILKETLYNSPWYELSPTERKVMHLMICELQQSPITLSSFVIYPLTTITFPRILNTNYTILNLMTMIMAK